MLLPLKLTTMKEVLIGACDDFSDKLRSRDELRQNHNLEHCLNQDGGFQFTYMSEVRGKCSCAPAWIIKMLKNTVPHAMKHDPDDDHFLSYEDMLIKQAFGFITSERYMHSCQGKSNTPEIKDGQDMGLGVKKTFDGIFNQRNVAMASECHICGKPRCMLTLSQAEDKRNNDKTTHQYLNNTMHFKCGMPLFTMDPAIFM
jgi:hypothetical protein